MTSLEKHIGWLPHGDMGQLTSLEPQCTRGPNSLQGVSTGHGWLSHVLSTLHFQSMSGLLCIHFPFDNFRSLGVIDSSLPISTPCPSGIAPDSCCLGWVTIFNLQPPLGWLPLATSSTLGGGFPPPESAVSCAPLNQLPSDLLCSLVSPCLRVNNPGACCPLLPRPLLGLPGGPLEASDLWDPPGDGCPHVNPWTQLHVPWVFSLL